MQHKRFWCSAKSLLLVYCRVAAKTSVLSAPSPLRCAAPPAPNTEDFAFSAVMMRSPLRVAARPSRSGERSTATEKSLRSRARPNRHDVNPTLILLLAARRQGRARSANASTLTVLARSGGSLSVHVENGVAAGEEKIQHRLLSDRSRSVCASCALIFSSLFLGTRRHSARSIK